MGTDAPTIPLESRRHTQFINITADVAKLLPEGFTGTVTLFCRHTTAGLTINENADPDVVHDLETELERLVPWKNGRFRHAEGNSAAHVKSSLLGVSLAIPVHNGTMRLGTWQSVYFCEFDGPRHRTVAVQLTIAG